MKGTALEELRSSCRQEFLNRVDEIIVFHALSEAHLQQIVEIQLGGLRARSTVSTGAIVGRQPFGGARHSGTNDKAGFWLNVVRWLSPRAIKEMLVPARAWRHPYLGRLP